MTPTDFVRDILKPGEAWCETVPGWDVPFDTRAQVLLVAIPGQESAWEHRIQTGSGVAHGLFQFERLGGVKGVLTHPATAELAKNACTALGVAADTTHVWGILATPMGDNLSVAFARLLLWSDPGYLPPVGNEEAGYEYYQKLWRPGKPSRTRWATVYPQAVAAILPEKKA